MSNVSDYFSKSFLQRCARNDKNYKYLILFYISSNLEYEEHSTKISTSIVCRQCVFTECIRLPSLNVCFRPNQTLMSVPFVVNKIPHHIYFNKLCLAQMVLPGFTIYQGGSTKSIAGEQFSMVLSKFGLLGMNCICTV